MILEPNCSIIAACLPCSGPLVAGGRAPESIIRSVRSVFSLRSLRSRRSGSPGNNSTELESGRVFNVLKSDSQVITSNDKNGLQTRTFDNGGINVTRDVDVDRY